jgi:hypothetical protein
VGGDVRNRCVGEGGEPGQGVGVAGGLLPPGPVQFAAGPGGEQPVRSYREGEHG